MIEPRPGIQLVNKQTQRVTNYLMSDLNRADVYQAENVRDLSTWVLKGEAVPAAQAKDWRDGNDLALDSIR